MITKSKSRPISPSNDNTAIIAAAFGLDIDTPAAAARRVNFNRWYTEIIHTGYPVYIGEGSFTDTFLVPDRVVSVYVLPEQRTCWQKERLLNLVLDALPPNITRIIWCDTDVHFPDPDWVHNVGVAMDAGAVAVQPFESVIYCGPRGTVERTFYSAAKQHLRPQKTNTWSAHPGFCWALDRTKLPHGQLYDRTPTPDADQLMSAAFTSAWETFAHIATAEMQPSLWRYAAQWAENCGGVRGPVASLPGNVVHHYHGNWESRRFRHKRRALSRGRFCPETDLVLAENKLWRWGNTESAQRTRQLLEQIT